MHLANSSEVEAPPEYVDYLLCKHFGWTITELYDQPSHKVAQFLTIINIEAQHNKGDFAPPEGNET